MFVAAKFSLKGGENFIAGNYPDQLAEIYSVISRFDAGACKTKISDEDTMRGKVLYNPACLNDEFKENFHALNWWPRKVNCKYTSDTFIEGNKSVSEGRTGSREMDIVKTGIPLGVEVQFGKYAFMAYNVCAKMTIFRNLGIINAGVEIVPVRQLTAEMSSGVSYYEQIEWDLRNRGEADIDIPVLVLGIAV